MPDMPRGKHDVRFNLPEMVFSHDTGSTEWLSEKNDTQGTSVDESRRARDYMLTPRADSVATHVLDSNLARADHVLRLRKQARQERRALKESGDYLGVQGVNPETGRMDVETPTDSEGSQLSPVPPIEEQVRPKRMIVTFDEKVTEKEKKKMLLKAREAELRRMEKSKKEAEELANQLMWRRHTKEWSIVKDPGVDSLPRKQTAMLAEESTSPRAGENRRQTETNLIDLDDSQREVGSYESQDSNSQNDQESCGTVMRTPHQRSLADVSRAALELFDNGISFDHSARSKKADQDPSSQYESSGGVSPTTKASPSPGHIANSKSQPFLGNCSNNSEEQTNKTGHRTATRKAFREVTNSLRATKSLSNILMANTQTRIQTMAKKHLLRRENTSSSIKPHIVGAWVENLDQNTDQANTIPPSLPIIKLQEPLRMMDETGCDSTTGGILQDLGILRDGILDLDLTENGKENEEVYPLGERIANEAASSMRGVIARDGSVYTHTTITTGSMRVKAKPLEDFNRLVAKKSGTPTGSCPEKKSSVSPKAEGTRGTTPSDTTCPAPTTSAQDAQPYVLKTTRAANRLQLRQKKGDSSTQEPTTPNSHSQAELEHAPKTMLKLASTEERKKKKKKKKKEEVAVADCASAERETKRNHCDGCSECLQIPGNFPAHLIEDDAIAPRSANGYGELVTQTAELGAVFDCTLGPFIAVLEMYCKIVWPVFDPYSSLWERNDNKQTTILDVLVLVLAVPGGIVILAMAIWGLRVLTVVGGCLLNAGRALVSNTSALFPW